MIKEYVLTSILMLTGESYAINSIKEHTSPYERKKEQKKEMFLNHEAILPNDWRSMFSKLYGTSFDFNDKKYSKL